MRLAGRDNNQIRSTLIQINNNPYAEGSCLIKMGGTHVICTASVEESVPHFLKGKRKGWITAEYSMLPRSTHTRSRRDVYGSAPNGRSQEIQRLISRSLRAAVDLSLLGERRIIIDCDVIQADGGTRTASITGSYVALWIAINYLLKKGIIRKNPIIHHIAAISCGVVGDDVVVDLDYNEDSSAKVDANFVMTAEGRFIEIQSSGEENTFSAEQMNAMLSLSQDAIKDLVKIQKRAIQIL